MSQLFHDVVKGILTIEEVKQPDAEFALGCDWRYLYPPVGYLPGQLLFTNKVKTQVPPCPLTPTGHIPIEYIDDDHIAPATRLIDVINKAGEEGRVTYRA